MPILLVMQCDAVEAEAERTPREPVPAATARRTRRGARALRERGRCAP